MLTILESINLSADYLAKKGVEDARLNAELLLCSILNCKKINLYLNFDKPLGDEEIVKYRELLKRRGDREPLQYITRNSEFYGLNFVVNQYVLIPRPETELLVEKVISDYKDKTINVLDIGTGTGNIAVSLGVNLPLAKITGVDSSENAVSLAQENAILNNCVNVKLMVLDILNDDYKQLDKFDVIVSNPPYISKDEYSELEPELRVHEPAAALTDMADGYLYYRRIAEISPEITNHGGKIYLEMGKGQSENIRNIFLKCGFSGITITKDYQNIDRIISGEIK